MKFFADTIIKPYALQQGYRKICEIGASFGENTDKLLEIEGATLTVIDPCVDANLREKYREKTNVRILAQGSLDALPTLSEPFDCILIDGDHNWYTVFNELRLIEEHQLLRPGGTIFLHDVGWPYGRRDMYYDPQSIPAEFVRPHRQKGMLPGKSELVDEGGSNDCRHNAATEGGPRNGVLTAVEDFVAQHPKDYLFCSTMEQHGLGVLHRRGGLRQDSVFAAWAARIKYRHARGYIGRMPQVQKQLGLLAGLVSIIALVWLVQRSAERE